MLAPPPHDPHIWPREGGFGRGGDSRLQISRKNLEYPGPGLQTPEFQKKSGVPPDSRLQISVPPDSRLQISRKNLEYLQTPDSRFPKKIWSTGTLDSRFWSLQSGVWGCEYSRFFLEIWSLESGARVLQIFSGNLESGVRGPGTPDFVWKSGVRGPGTPDFFWKSGVWSPGPGYSRFFWKSGVWSPGPGYSRFFLEIWSLESGARVLQIFSGNLESGVRGPGTPDFLWKSGVWSPGPWYSRFF